MSLIRGSPINAFGSEPVIEAITAIPKPSDLALPAQLYGSSIRK